MVSVSKTNTMQLELLEDKQLREREKRYFIEKHLKDLRIKVNEMLNNSFEGKAFVEAEAIYQKKLRLGIVTDVKKMDKTKQQERKLRDLFNMLDVDCSGFIDSFEFLLGVKRLCVATTRKKALEEYKQIDENGDGLIDFEEFSKWYNETKSRSKFSLKSIGIRQALKLKKMARDKSGKTDQDVAKRVLVAKALATAKARISQAFDRQRPTSPELNPLMMQISHIEKDAVDTHQILLESGEKETKQISTPKMLLESGEKETKQISTPKILLESGEKETKQMDTPKMSLGGEEETQQMDTPKILLDSEDDSSKVKIANEELLFDKSYF